MKSLFVSVLGTLLLSSIVNPSYSSAQSASLIEDTSLDQCNTLPADRIVVEQSQILLSHDAGGAFIGPVAQNIPAGSYNLSTFSFEDHTATNDPTQAEEQWYFEGYYQNSLVYTSPTTTDIPDDIDSVSDDFGTVVLPQIDAIRWVHAAYPDPTYQSVFPSCINFDPVEVEEQPEIDCTVNFTNIDELSIQGMATISPDDNILEFSYDFGDNTAAVTANSGQPVTHDYQHAGTYTVTATSTNDDQSTVTCKTQVDVPSTEGSGDTLGETTDIPNDNSSVLGANSGSNAVLANTGVSSLLTIITGFSLITATACVTLIRKNQQAG